MRKIHLFILIVFLLGGVLAPQPANAQSLSFEVPRQVVNVFVNEDGTISVEYTIEFNNRPGAAVIDFIDIGMPNSAYQMGSITAEVNGQPVNDIEKSPYVDPGIAIGLGKYSIQPGQSGTLHVMVGRVDGAIGKSTLEEAEEYASIVFTPNWFDRQFVEGNTDYTVSIYLPPGLQPEQPRYHTPSNNWPGTDEPYSNFDAKGRVYYSWNAIDANSYTEYKFGASFPSRLVPAAAIIATETPNSRSFNLDSVCPCLFFLGFIGAIIGFFVLAVRSSQKRKLQYLPPKISVEGHGIKRGLTAVEAAILMEQPMDKIMTMILFSVLKKGAATVTTRDPLKLEIVKPAPQGLYAYEESFLDAFGKDKPAERKQILQNMMVALVKSVSEKMKGFSRKETIEYYETIMERAYQQVEAANTPEVKSETYEQVMDWTMLDRKWDDRTKNTFGTGPVFVPTWWWRYDPVIRSSGFGGAQSRPVSTSTSIPSSSSGQSVTLPKLPGSDFAASVVGGVQSFSAGVIGDLTSFTSGITDRTNPVPKPSTSSYRGGSGGGGSSCACACACACAGCACACAGGGR